MDFKIRGIELVKCALTRQHTAFQPRDSAGLYLIHQRFKIPFQKSEPLRTQQNPNTPLNVPKQAAPPDHRLHIERHLDTMQTA